MLSRRTERISTYLARGRRRAGSIWPVPSLSFAVAYVGGILTLFAPCSALLIPSFFAYAFNSRAVLARRTAVFFLGLVAGLVPLGAALGALGDFLRDYLPTITFWGGLIIVVLGIWQALSLPVPHLGSVLLQPLRRAIFRRPASAPTPPATPNAATRKSSPLGVFLLGFTYGLAGTGCSGPILGAMSQFIVLGGSAWLGAATMLCYAAGMFTPVALLAFAWEAASSSRQWFTPRPLRFLGRQTTVGNLISGLVFIVLGAAMAFIGGPRLSTALISPQTQTEIENQVRLALAGVPNWLFVVLVILVVAAVVVWRREQARKTAPPTLG